MKCKLGSRESELVSFIVMSSPVPASCRLEGHDAQRDEPGIFSGGVGDGLGQRLGAEALALDKPGFES